MKRPFKNYQKTLLYTFGLTFLVIFFSLPAHALTAQEAFQKGKNAISSAKTLSANFTIKMSGNTVTGKILSKGNKFALTSSVSSNWYNGTDLYTYIASKSETTVFRPSASELAQVNPLLYLKSASNFNVTATKTKKSGLETIVLIPKTSGTGVKSVTIDLDAKTFLPKYIKIIPSSGGPIDLTISNLKLNSSINDSSFTYPKSSYPKAKIIDMR